MSTNRFVTNLQPFPSKIIGAWGVRHATLEATGTWEEISPDGQFHGLTSAGLFGKVTSKSPFIPSLSVFEYQGHVLLDGRKATMQRFVPDVPPAPYHTPTILLVGTSMSAGKTTVARIIIRQLKRYGLTVLGAKLTGAGRYRDILSMADVGADAVFDFVDVGLPSTVHPPDEYAVCLEALLARMAGVHADVAVVEIRASPLEPYNGETAFQRIKQAIRGTVLCASDPYAAYGVMEAFGLELDLVSGVATNTRGGVDLIRNLCGVPALNLMDPATWPELNRILTGLLQRRGPNGRRSA